MKVQLLSAFPLRSTGTGPRNKILRYCAIELSYFFDLGNKQGDSYKYGLGGRKGREKKIYS